MVHHMKHDCRKLCTKIAHQQGQSTTRQFLTQHVDAPSIAELSCKLSPNMVLENKLVAHKYSGERERDSVKILYPAPSSTQCTP